MAASTTKRIASIAAWTIVIAMSAYFISNNVLHYFNYTRSSYTDYFWARRNWLLMHIAGGLTATVVGPFQFIQKIRRRNVKIHRLLGRIYLVSILIGAPAGLYMAIYSGGNVAYQTGLGMLAIVWFSTVAMAYTSIRKGSIIQHRQWMTRSYVVTFAFTSFRLTEKVLEYFNIANDEIRSTLLAWACWSIPLFITEIFLQASKINRINKFNTSKSRIGLRVENDVSLLE